MVHEAALEDLLPQLRTDLSDGRLQTLLSQLFDPVRRLLQSTGLLHLLDSLVDFFLDSFLLRGGQLEWVLAGLDHVQSLPGKEFGSHQVIELVERFMAKDLVSEVLLAILSVEVGRQQAFEEV